MSAVRVCTVDEKPGLDKDARRRVLERELREQLKDRLPLLDIDRSRERRFFATRPELARQLAGQWVALDGDELLSHGTDLTDVVRRAWESGRPDPYIEELRVRDPKIAWIF